MKLKWKDGQWIDKETGLVSQTKAAFDYSKPWTGFIAGDFSGYECPVTGNWIEGRKAHSENLKKTGCRLLEKGEKEERAKKYPIEQEKRMSAAIEVAANEAAKELC